LVTDFIIVFDARSPPSEDMLTLTSWNAWTRIVGESSATEIEATRMIDKWRRTPNSDTLLLEGIFRCDLHRRVSLLIELFTPNGPIKRSVPRIE
jgi:hypothetical protein